jgi:hypothetical protein
MVDQRSFAAASQPIGQPVDRSATRAIYIVTAEDPFQLSGVNPPGIQQYQATDLRESEHYLEILGGFELTHAQADKLRKNPKLKPPKTEVNVKLPWSTVKKIENVTYKKVQKKR